MKRFIALFLIITFTLFILGCGDTKVINGTEYDTYGIANSNEIKNKDIKYRVIIGNVVWSCILVETVIVPIYFICFSLYEPVSTKNHTKPKGAL